MKFTPKAFCRDVISDFLVIATSNFRLYRLGGETSYGFV